MKRFGRYLVGRISKTSEGVCLEGEGRVWGDWGHGANLH